jgi:aspartate/tyrosine/aromatic aminotransferase
MTNSEFGAKVAEKARQLAVEGRDAMQTTKILCDADPKASNYGIGIILAAAGGAYPTSPTLLKYIGEELKRSSAGTYRNSMNAAEMIKEKVLQWQRVPKEHWQNFVFGMPSDAGTGCVKTGLEYAILQQPGIDRVGVEELGWPAYKAISKSAGLRIEEYPTASSIDEDKVLTMYQAGPINTTGAVMSAETVAARARTAANSGRLLLLDRAYPGFEFARDLPLKGYDAIMAASYSRHIEPFVSMGIPFILAVSPTKAFGSFALRPAGFLLVHVPEQDQRTKAQQLMNTLIRARGSSFEHPSTRGLVRAMIESLDALETEHQGILKRMAAAEETWLRYSKGTSVEALFTNEYAGLFRNPTAKDDAAEGLYGAHLYPVLSGGRCRINITGISSDEAKAKLHVEAFAKYIE